MVRTEATAEASLAAILDRIKLGIAIAAMIKIIATTMSNSMSEKPFCLLRMCIESLLENLYCQSTAPIPAGLVPTQNPLRIVGLDHCKPQQTLALGGTGTILRVLPGWIGPSWTLHVDNFCLSKVAVTVNSPNVKCCVSWRSAGTTGT